MIELLFSVIPGFDLIAGLLSGGLGLVTGAGGFGLSLLGGLLSGWKKWALIGVGVFAVVVYVGVLHLSIAKRDTRIAQLEGVEKLLTDRVKAANLAVSNCLAAQAANIEAVERIRRTSDAAVAAITADRDRIAAEAPKVKIVREKIHVSSKECVGNPRAYRDADDWLRANPDTAGSAPGDREGERGGDRAATGPSGLQGRTVPARRPERRGGRRESQARSGARGPGLPQQGAADGRVHPPRYG